MPQTLQMQMEGARTILILEGVTASVMHWEFREDLLPSVLAETKLAPDEVFLVETDIDPWRIYLLKRDDDHWPDAGMPPLGSSYDPETSQIQKHLEPLPPKTRLLYEQASGIPCPPSWALLTIEKDQFSDLKSDG